MKKLLTITLLLFSLTVFSKTPKNQYVRVSTDYGYCIIKLYNETPKHRDNFIKLANKGFYNGTLFHRVVPFFFIQGGDPDSKDPQKNKTGAKLGDGNVGYTIPAEFRPNLFHKRGAVAASRKQSPTRESSGCQFYIIQGQKYTDVDLDKVEKLVHRKIPKWQREQYKTIGGTRVS